MKLDNRLTAVVGFIPKGVVVSDVGCDHGKVLHYCLLELNSPFVFGSDISKKSVQKTTDLLTKHNYSNFKTLTSDGLNAYTKEELNIIGCVVIAGMGGIEMVHILNNVMPKLQELNKLNTLVLQPQNNADVLRDWLQKNSFAVVDDVMVKEKDKFYNILKVVANKPQHLTKLQVKFGITNLKKPTPVFMEFLTTELNKKEKMLNNLKSNLKTNFERINLLSKECAELQKLLNDLENKA